MAHSTKNFSSFLIPKKVISKLYKTLLGTCFVWTRNMVVHIKDRTQTGGVDNNGGGVGRIFGFKLQEKAGSWREFDGGGRRSFYSSTNIIAIMK